MAALSKGRKIAIAREPGPYQQLVTGNILAYAMDIIEGDQEVPESHRLIAREVVQSPELYTYAFASAALMRSEFDVLEDVANITDEQMFGVIVALWPVIAAPKEEAISRLREDALVQMAEETRAVADEGLRVAQRAQGTAEQAIQSIREIIQTGADLAFHQNLATPPEPSPAT